MKKDNIFSSCMALLLSLMMVLSVLPVNVFADNAEYLNGFSDVRKGSWEESSINDLVNKGIIKGYLDGTFKPNEKITRGEFVHLLNKAFSLQNSSNVIFKDVSKDMWCYSAISVAVGENYTAGYPDGTFRPNAPVTRAEAALFIARILKAKGDEEKNEITLPKDNLPFWAKDAIKLVIEKNFVQGYPDGTFRANNFITRAETAVVINKVERYIHEGKNDEKQDGKEGEVKQDKLQDKKVEKEKKEKTKANSGMDIKPPTPDVPKDDLSMRHIEKNYYIFNIDVEDRKEDIKALLKEKYPALTNYYIGKIFKDSTKVLLYLEDEKINCAEAKDIPKVLSGIYMAKDGEFVAYNEKVGSENITLFVGDVKLEEPFKTSKIVLGFKGNQVNGGLDLQTSTKKIDGLNFCLEQTSKESMIYDAAISQTSNVNMAISNLEITDNTFEFGDSTIHAKNAIKIISRLENGYLKINHNTIKGLGAGNKEKRYNNAAIAVNSATKNGTLTEIMNNRISGYGYHGIGITVNEKASLTVEGNILEDVGQNGIDITLFGRGEEVHVKNNIISHYGSKEITEKENVLSSNEKVTNKFEVGLGIGYTEKTVYGVKINGKYYSNKDKFLRDLFHMNTILEKTQNDQNKGVLNCTPIYMKYPERFKDPIEELNREFSRLQKEELIIVKDDDEDLIFPKEEIKEKTVKAIKIVGDGGGKVILNPSLTITDDLTVDLPNCNLQNNAKVDPEKVHIIRIRENDYSNFALKPEAETIALKSAEEFSVEIVNIQNKTKQEITKEKSVLTNHIRAFVDNKETTEFRIDDQNDKVILSKELMNRILKFATIRIEYEDSENDISKVKKSFDITVNNISSLKAGFENGTEAVIFESFAPQEGIKIKIREVKNASGDAVDLTKINLEEGLGLHISYHEAKKSHFEVNGDVITLKKEFLDMLSAPIFGSTHDINLFVTDLEHNILDAKATLKIKVVNQSGGLVTPKSTLTFTQGNAPKQGMTFEITSLRNAKGIELQKNEIDLKNCVDVEPFPVDWTDDSLEKLSDGRIRFNRKYLDIDTEKNTVTIKKEYLDRLVVNDKDTEFGTKQIIIKYRDKKAGIDYRSEKFVIHIKKALKPLSTDTSVTSQAYTIENDTIKSGNDTITAFTTISDFVKNIQKANFRQVLRVYAPQYIKNNTLEASAIYKYKKKYENVKKGDYLVVTAEDGKTVKLYEIIFDGGSEETLISVKDAKVVWNLGVTFIEVAENITAEQLKNALEIVQGATLSVINHSGQESSDIKEGYKLLVQKEGKTEERVIKIRYSQRTYRALIVANSNYGNEKMNLAGPENDKLLMKKVFENQEIGSIKFNKIVVAENTTKEQFLKKIKEAFEGANNDDVSYLYYSGHGNNIDGISYICTTDLKDDKEAQKNAWISVNELKAELDEVQGTKVLIFDSCNAGGFIGKKVDAITSPTPNSSRTAREFNENIARTFVVKESRAVDYLTSNDYKVLTASSEDEYSFEDKKEKVGKFTKVLAQIAGVNGTIMGDTSKDGKISLEEAYRYLEDNVVYTSHIQAFPRNDSYTLFEIGANATPISNDTSISSTKDSMDENNLTIIVQGKQKLIKSNKFKISDRVSVGDFLAKIEKGHPNQRLKVVKLNPLKIEKQDTDTLEKLDFLEVTAEDGSTANYIITVEKDTALSDVLTISSKKDSKEIGFYTIIRNAKIIRTGLKKITEDSTVEEFLSNIEKGDIKQTLRVIDKDNAVKIDTDKLKKGDKLIVQAENGNTDEYSILLDEKPLELEFRENAFKVIAGSGPFGTKIVSYKKELDTSITVEEFLSYITNKDKFVNIKVNSGTTYVPKTGKEKLEMGDYLLLASGGAPKRYNLVVKSAGIPKPPTPPTTEELHPDFGDDFEIDMSNKFNLKIKSKNTKLSDTMTVEEFFSKLKNRDKFREIKVTRGMFGEKVETSATLQNGDKLFVETKPSTSSLISVTETKTYIIIVEKSSSEEPSTEEIKDPDFGGAYRIGTIKKNEILSDREELTTDITVAQFIAKITNSLDYNSIKIKEAYGDKFKKNDDKIEDNDRLVLVKGTKESVYYLRNVTQTGGGISIPIIPPSGGEGGISVPIIPPSGGEGGISVPIIPPSGGEGGISVPIITPPSPDEPSEPSENWDDID